MKKKSVLLIITLNVQQDRLFIFLVECNFFCFDFEFVLCLSDLFGIVEEIFINPEIWEGVVEFGSYLAMDLIVKLD